MSILLAGAFRAIALSPAVAAAAAPPATAPTLRSQTTAVSGTGDIDMTSVLTTAGYQTDDVLLMYVECDSVNFLTGDPDHPATPAGGWAPIRSAFTPAGRQAVTGSNSPGARLGIFWVRGSALTAQTVVDTGDHTHVVIQVWQDVKAGADPFGVDAVGNGSSQATTLTLPGLTTPVDNCRVIYAVTDFSDSTAAFVSGSANASLSDITEHFDAGTISGSGGRLAVISGLKAAAGASGDLVSTVQGSSILYRYMTLCLEPLA